MSKDSKKRKGIHQIAQLARVSIGTVDRALHGRPGINPTTRQRILKIASQIGYSPNLAARALSIARANVRIGVCIPREIHFFYDQMWGGVLDEEKRASHLGIQFLHRPVHALGEHDTDAFRDLVEQKVDGIILTAGNPAGLSPLINDAEENGIRVICVSTDAPRSCRSSVVCVEPRLNGCLAGELMAKILPPGSAVGIVAGMLSAEDHRKKADGFIQAFPKYSTGSGIVEVIEGHEDEAESFQKTSGLLDRFPDLAGLYVNTVNCLPVCQALLDRGLAGKIKLVATDLFPEMAVHLERGTITASIYQHPFRQGQIAVRVLSDYLTNKTELPPFVHLSPGVIMASNFHLFREMRRSDAELDI
ncbi:MAG TPA: substrate-binding domain-containing protein [Candidatus Saccharimonadales bacterium]|nr:substrate-binding domain-containing protein [Candidatus Saccharimonadales bacterium]